MFKYKAERADDKDWVEGYLVGEKWIRELDDEDELTINPQGYTNNLIGIEEIKPETLRIVIGDSEFTQEEVEELVKPKSCESCKYSILDQANGKVLYQCGNCESSKYTFIMEADETCNHHEQKVES
jgi:formate dehydrogenase assembly factor FdhD